MWYKRKRVLNLCLELFIKSGDGSAEPQHCLRRRNIYVPKGVHRPRKVQKNNKKRGTLLKEFLFIKVAMTYSPTKQPKAGSLMRVADSRAKGRRSVHRAVLRKTSITRRGGRDVYIQKKDTLLSVLSIKSGDDLLSHNVAIEWEQRASLLALCRAWATSWKINRKYVNIKFTTDNAGNRAMWYKRKRVLNLCLELFIKSGDGSAEPQHCLRRRNIYVPKGVHRPRKVQKNNKKRGTLLKEFLFIKSGDDRSTPKGEG